VRECALRRYPFSLLDAERMRRIFHSEHRANADLARLQRKR
jgi:hypothetical protein